MENEDLTPSLYLVTGEEYSRGRGTLDVVEEAIDGGVDIVQMREKGMSREDLTSLGRKLSEMCRSRQVMFIVNDDPHLAKEVEADGVHLGQEDVLKYPVRYTRSVLGNGRVIGLSTHSIKDVMAANGEDIDYIAFGPVFPTKTKDYSVGKTDIPSVMECSERRVFFIGGIDNGNVDELLDLGAYNIAVIKYLTAAEDVKKAAEEMVRKLKHRTGKDKAFCFRINGKPHSARGHVGLSDIILRKGLDVKRIVVEYNREIIPSEKWDRISLKDGDNLEILSFVGGG